jgi:hypothetical protein
MNSLSNYALISSIYWTESYILIQTSSRTPPQQSFGDICINSIASISWEVASWFTLLHVFPF